MFCFDFASHVAPIRGRQDHQHNGKPADVVMNHIKDLTAVYDANKLGAPAYTADKQVFHTDSGDVISLLCLEEAAEGGESKLSSSWRVYNEIAETRPDLIRTLAESWPVELYAYISNSIHSSQFPQTNPSPASAAKRARMQTALSYISNQRHLPLPHAS